MNSKPIVAVLGLGYVGLPLAVQLSKHYTLYGIDINTQKIQELKAAHDRMGEVTTDALHEANIHYSESFADLKNADVIIVAVPTPVDAHNVPDLSPVHNAARAVGKHLKKGAIVVFESTVYPGVTEEECAPILAKESGLRYNEEFFVGYSPERINPGDHEHTIDRVVKIVAGSTPEVTQTLAHVYGSVVKAGIHIAPSIRVAEAAKVIENIQRDINIALVNELAMLFERMDINIHDVLRAAGTKWNFQRYTPGLVGGHCIGVDPYYLTHKAIEYNFQPNIILAGRRINDNMHTFYVEKVIRELNTKGIAASKATVVVLGLTFKENCSDERNSRTTHLVKELKKYGTHVIGIDPWLTADRIASYAMEPAELSNLRSIKADAVIVTVPHKQFVGLDLSGIPVVIDIKGTLKQ